MEPIAAIMLILGCDHSMMVCREIARPAYQYTSVAECEADKSLQVRFVDNYPMAVAECVAAPGLEQGQKVVIDWRIDASNGLHAEVRLRDTGPLTAEAIRGGRPFGGV